MENSKPSADYDPCENIFPQRSVFLSSVGSVKILIWWSELCHLFFFKDSLKVICFAMRMNYVVLSTAVAPLNIMSSIFLGRGKVSVQRAIFNYHFNFKMKAVFIVFFFFYSWLNPPKNKSLLVLPMHIQPKSKC